jgi:hypothetical protein
MSAPRCLVLPWAATRLEGHLEELQWAGTTTVYEDGHHRHDREEPTTEEVDGNNVWGNGILVGVGIQSIEADLELKTVDQHCCFF